MVDLLTGKVVAKNDDISTSGGDFDAQVSFTTEPGVQYVVFASSVDAPGLGDYTLNTTVTGTPIANALRSASAETLLPPPVFNEKGKIYNLTYAPLTGGLAQPIQISGLNQQLFGNCAFLAALGATFGKIDANLTDAKAKQSAILNNAIKSDPNNYTLTFYSYLTGTAKNVTVDNQVVTDGGKLFGAKWLPKLAVKPDQAKDQPIWGSIFERAYAKFRGEETGKNGYDETGNGDIAGIALKRVTGKAIENIFWKDGKEFELATELTQTPDGKFSYSSQKLPDGPNEIFNRIKTALDGGRYVATGTIGGGNDSKLLYGGVLQQSHAYSVHNAYEKDGQKLILLRNPCGRDNSINAKAAEDPSDELNDGFITIKFEEFLKNFDGVGISQA